MPSVKKCAYGEDWSPLFDNLRSSCSYCVVTLLSAQAGWPPETNNPILMVPPVGAAPSYRPLGNAQRVIRVSQSNPLAPGL